MNRRELSKMIEFHESRLAHILHLLDHLYYQIEEEGTEKEWVSRLTREKKILAWLREQKADDE
ncbi:hypothetical protein [Larkinella punicea]|uniref:Uncharacterized protein n=1 Tax=Larkinella punicea TaxID=2315727 RepID=A0A368JJ59_9BACT|nr:hypothetical protein [Larkinella punicea]RCR67688.1 hypothetical protein DUE52_19980 [Larkinella punicea]